jgi:ubiquinone/menaquinone biosynthesis C-methylase UbiE
LSLPEGVDLRSEYDVWHQRVFDSDPDHADDSSPWYQLVRERLGDVTGLRVLEVACGRGGFVCDLRRRGASVTGCDFSGAALRVGKERMRRTGADHSAQALVQGDAQGLPFADASFDIVISCETIEHVPDPWRAVSEMHRVTRGGGRLYLTTPNYLNFMGLYELYSLFAHPGRKDDQPYDRRQWFPQIRQYVQRAGWKILRTDGTVHQFPFIPGHNPVGFPVLESNRTLRRMLSPFAYHYFVIAEKRSAA